VFVLDLTAEILIVMLPFTLRNFSKCFAKKSNHIVAIIAMVAVFAKKAVL